MRKILLLLCLMLMMVVPAGATVSQFPGGIATDDIWDYDATTGWVGTYKMSLPTLTANDTICGIATTQTLTNKTLTSPTLTAPTLGVATATTVNKVTITAPATGSTLTIADGKTLTASNTLTLTGTDSASVAFGPGGTAGLIGAATHNYAGAAADWTLSTTEARATFISASNANGAVNAIKSAAQAGQMHFIYNNTGQVLTFKVTGQTGGSVATGKYAVYVDNGTDVVEIYEQP